MDLELRLKGRPSAGWQGNHGRRTRMKGRMAVQYLITRFSTLACCLDLYMMISSVGNPAGFHRES